MPTYRLPPDLRLEYVFRPHELSEAIDWGQAQTGMPELWKQSEGEGVRVAVLDTGCEIDHPDLAEGIVGSRDFTRSRFGAYDKHGHGTHCAGIIGARRNNKGCVGNAPKCSLLIGKVLGDDGGGTTRSIVDGIDWAVEEGAGVISMSLGAPGFDSDIAASIERAVTQGVIIFAAAGNDGRPNSINFPAKLKSTISIGAIQRNGQLARFSSQGKELDFAAPGQDVTSTFLNGGYAKQSGTSMAAPFAAGAGVCILAYHRKGSHTTPVLTPDDMREHMKRGCIDAGPVGHDPSYGWGIINAAKLIPPPQVTPPPIGSDDIVISGIEVNGIPGVLVFKPQDRA